MKRKLWYPLEREKLNRAPTFYTFQPRALFLLEREIERRKEGENENERVREEIGTRNLILKKYHPLLVILQQDWIRFPRSNVYFTFFLLLSS